MARLKAELEFLALYVEIEQMRFGDRLSVEVDAAPETRDPAGAASGRVVLWA